MSGDQAIACYQTDTILRKNEEGNDSESITLYQSERDSCKGQFPNAGVRKIRFCTQTNEDSSRKRIQNTAEGKCQRTRCGDAFQLTLLRVPTRISRLVQQLVTAYGVSYVILLYCTKWYSSTTIDVSKCK